MSRVPDVAGEVLGYRAWRVVVAILEPPRLFSIYSDFEWLPGRWTVAGCEMGPPEGIPHRACRCGIYAAKDRRHLAELGYNEVEDDEDIVVIGEVGLAGDVIRATRGWRAERARPVRLWVAHEDWPLVKPLSDVYGIPVGLSNILRRGEIEREYRN